MDITQDRFQHFLKKGVRAEILATIPHDILNTPSFPYNRDRSERWCYACKAFRSVSEFYTSPTGHHPRCKQHEKLPIEIKRSPNLKQNYHGFSSKEYETILAEQGGVCAVCKQPEQRLLRGKIAPLSIDHCHTTQRIRALLCHECNTAFGQLREDPKRIKALLTYAERWQGV